MQDSQTTDEQLLRDHVTHRDEAAFAQLVQRHVNLVFGTALRILGDRTAAEEVSQNVFITLARKAATIRTGTGLAGWLHRAAILEARLRQRTDLRRMNREDLAAQLGTTMPTPESPDPLPFEILDDALLELPEKDRRTLFLRYFENRPFREIAHTLGIGEDAAQKRTSRALDALAGILRRRGAATVTATLAAKTLEAAALTIAPAQLATSITSVALAAAGTAASSSALAILVAKLMALTNTQTAAVCVLLAAAPVGYQWHAASTLRQAVADTARDLASTTNALARAEAEAAGATRRLDATSTRLAETRSLLRRATDQISTAASTPEASLYLWSENASHVRVPKSIAPSLRLSGSIPLPTSPGFKPQSQALEAVDASGTLSEPLAEALGVTPDEANAIREAFGRTAATLQQQVHAAAYLTNQVPAQFRTDGKPAVALVTPALPDRGHAIRDELRQTLNQLLGTERANLVWQQAESTFEHVFNQFGGVERIQAAVLNGPADLSFWNVAHDLDGKLTSWGNSGGNLSIDTFPVRLRPIVAGWLTNSQPQRP
jgi:RNA polymerase sigma factor (sigma-70 family)